MTIYDFKVKDYKGNEIDLNNFRGKVILIVNTATKCGFTKQYDELVPLYKKYKDQGFEILDFPCNQFFKQAPGTSQEIHDACVMRFALDFTQCEKIDVNGKNEHPLYRFLKDNCPINTGKNIKWNFTKFLVNRDGKIVNRFEPKENPYSFEDKIIELL